MSHALTEIKKGQVGTGLLVENDGYISLDFKDNKALCEAVEIEGNPDMKELPRPFIVNAVFQKYGIENANGRIYPEAVLRREVEKYQKVIADGRSAMELNHPDTNAIDLERVCGKIIELHWEGRTLVGKMEIPITEGFRKYGMITDLADKVAHLIMSGFKIGVSSRALGSVRQVGGVLMVNDDLEIICWDIVSGPSTPNAYIETKEESLKPYIESVEKEGKIIKEDRLSKFEEWLTD